MRMEYKRIVPRLLVAGLKREAGADWKIDLSSPAVVANVFQCLAWMTVAQKKEE